MAVMPMTRLDLPRAELVLLPVASAAQAQRVLSVEFRSPGGRLEGDRRRRHARAAIEWARESCPDGTTWEPVGWEDLYGD